jgi:epoxide hydrolase
MSTTISTHDVTLDDRVFRILRAGDPCAPTIIFLHGWPQDSTAWKEILLLAAHEYQCIAVDLPGIGGSKTTGPCGSKILLAHQIHDLIAHLGLKNVTMVGHDVGGMITFSYLREFGSLNSAVIMNTVIPGVAPWDDVIRIPWLWHFAFHSIPDLPEQVTANHLPAYFDYFYDATSAVPSSISKASRSQFVSSYQSPDSLRQGFEFYRALWKDAQENAASSDAISIPLLYLRGDQENGDINAYVAGFKQAGMTNIQSALVPGAGHFTPQENPADTWSAIRRFLRG